MKCSVRAVLSLVTFACLSVACGDEVQAPNVPPTATIAAPGGDTTVTLGDAVVFRGTADDADGSVMSYAWDYGDGSHATVEDPGAHTYAARGVYTVTYQVTDDDGATSAPDTVTVSINQIPTSSIDSPGQDTTVTVGDAVDFQGSASDEGGTVASHVWDFGDGNGSGVEDPGTYTYAAAGTYTVTYRVTDDDGVSSRPDSVTVIVNQPPTAVIASPSKDTTALWPYALDFQGTATDTDGEIVTHHWDFGDGNEADVEDPGPYAYVEVGTYTVTYQVTDNDGAVSETAQVVVTVEESASVAPEPGHWFGGGDNVLVGFDVDPQGTTITQVVISFGDWQCGGVTRNERFESTNPSGWPITDGDFSIGVSFPPYELTVTVSGTFQSHTEVSGTYSALSYGTTCSAGWDASRVSPEIAVFVNADFSGGGILGFKWLPGRQVTLEIDNGADGSIDFTRTTRVDTTGTARFHEGDTPPYTIAEGDSIRMWDPVTTVGYVVLYLTLDSVDAATDVVSGSAREGTAVLAGIENPDPYIGGPLVWVDADANGAWSADFTGLFDILPSTALRVTANCPVGSTGLGCGGYTAIFWVP